MFLSWVLISIMDPAEGCYDLPLRRMPTLAVGIHIFIVWTLVGSVILFSFALMRESCRDACLHASLPVILFFRCVEIPNNLDRLRTVEIGFLTNIKADSVFYFNWPGL